MVRRWAASEPISGSVSPKAPIFSSRAICGSHSWRCSSEPQTRIEVIARPDCTPKKVLTLASPRDSSIVIRLAATALIPGQP